MEDQLTLKEIMFFTSISCQIADHLLMKKKRKSLFGDYESAEEEIFGRGLMCDVHNVGNKMKKKYGKEKAGWIICFATIEEAK